MTQSLPLVSLRAKGVAECLDRVVECPVHQNDIGIGVDVVEGEETFFDITLRRLCVPIFERDTVLPVEEGPV